MDINLQFTDGNVLKSSELNQILDYTTNHQERLDALRKYLQAYSVEGIIRHKPDDTSTPSSGWQVYGNISDICSVLDNWSPRFYKATPNVELVQELNPADFTQTSQGVDSDLTGNDTSDLFICLKDSVYYLTGRFANYDVCLFSFKRFYFDNWESFLMKPFGISPCTAWAGINTASYSRLCRSIRNEDLPSTQTPISDKNIQKGLYYYTNGLNPITLYKATTDFPMNLVMPYTNMEKTFTYSDYITMIRGSEQGPKRLGLFPIWKSFIDAQVNMVTKTMLPFTQEVLGCPNSNMIQAIAADFDDATSTNRGEGVRMTDEDNNITYHSLFDKGSSTDDDTTFMEYLTKDANTWTMFEQQLALSYAYEHNIAEKTWFGWKGRKWKYENFPNMKTLLNDGRMNAIVTRITTIHATNIFEEGKQDQEVKYDILHRSVIFNGMCIDPQFELYHGGFIYAQSSSELKDQTHSIYIAKDTGAVDIAYANIDNLYNVSNSICYEDATKDAQAARVQNRCHMNFLSFGSIEKPGGYPLLYGNYLESSYSGTNDAMLNLVNRPVRSDHIPPYYTYTNMVPTNCISAEYRRDSKPKGIMTRLCLNLN